MTSALIVGDLQSGITRNYPFTRKLLPVISEILPTARAAGVLIVFIRTELRVNGLDVAPSNALITACHAAGDIYHQGSPGTEVDPALKVADGDVIVTKRRGSAFAGTELDMILRGQGVDSLAVAGVATSAMVAATVYDAFDRDYRLTVIADACADPEPDVHDFFVDSVFPGRGVDVTTARSWAAGLRDSREVAASSGGQGHHETGEPASEV
jgi:nicotinamidase-related amidase